MLSQLGDVVAGTTYFPIDFRTASLSLRLLHLGPCASVYNLLTGPIPVVL